MSLRGAFEQRRVLITGASSGVGAALAETIVQLGGQCLLSARRQDRLEQLAHKLGTQVDILAGDLTHQATREALQGWVVDHWGALDILVNNAGVGAFGAFADSSESRLRRVFELNFFAATELTRTLLPLLQLGRQPVIVNIGSVLGHRAAPFKSEYSASKFALHGWSDALRCELASIGVHVLLISPSTIATEFSEHLLETAETPRPLTAGVSPTFVARRIVRGIATRKREMIFPTTGRALVYLDRILPGMADSVMVRLAPRPSLLARG